MDTLLKAQEEGRAPWDDIELNTREYIVFKDKYPVTEGHLLVVPKENNLESMLKCFQFAIATGEANVVSQKTNITGFNVGMNVGKSAGQTCMYPHVHLIFRRDKDIENPTGGVRNVIPEKGNYKSNEIDWDNLAVKSAG